MNKIAELGDKNENLPKILNLYESQLSDIADRLEIRGRRLEISCSKNSAWLHFYDQRKVEIHSLVKHFKAEEARVRGVAHRKYRENYSVSLSERDINKYIDAEKDYLYIHSLLIEVEELYEQYGAAVNALTTMNYALSNITKIRVASLENVEI